MADDGILTFICVLLHGWPLVPASSGSQDHWAALPAWGHVTTCRLGHNITTSMAHEPTEKDDLTCLARSAFEFSHERPLAVERG